MYMFTGVKIYSAVQNADREPTKQECQEILKMLNNSSDYHQRIALKQEDCGDIQLSHEDHCHASSRIFADLNKNRGWQKVSGYLFCSQDRSKFDQGEKSLIRLSHHSVVQDEYKNFLETMEKLYPLNKYFFIIHHSGLLGWDLQAF